MSEIKMYSQRRSNAWQRSSTGTLGECLDIPMRPHRRTKETPPESNGAI
jgi:hypothetical protein